MSLNPYLNIDPLMPNQPRPDPFEMKNRERIEAVNPPGQEPIDIGPAPEHVAGWEGFLNNLSTDTNLQQSLIQAGLQMMTPQAPGENFASKIGQGVQVGMGSYQKNQDRELLREQKEKQIAATQASTEQAKASTQNTLAGLPSTVANAQVAEATAKNKIKDAGTRSGLLESQASTAEITAEFAREMKELEVTQKGLTADQSVAQTANIYDTILKRTEGGSAGNAALAEAKAMAAFNMKVNPHLDETTAIARALKFNQHYKTRAPAAEYEAELREAAGLNARMRDSDRNRAEKEIKEIMRAFHAERDRQDALVGMGPLGIEKPPEGYEPPAAGSPAPTVTPEAPLSPAQMAQVHHLAAQLQAGTAKTADGKPLPKMSATQALAFAKKIQAKKQGM